MKLLPDFMKDILRSLVPEGLHPGQVADRQLKRLLADSKVVAGPFQGMRYIDRASGSAHIPKLVGSYESELHPWLAEIRRQSFSTVIDVGAAEGYYAVGFARMFPNATVIAYEADADARQMLKDLIALNGVGGRLEARGLCTPEDLEAIPASKAFVMMDVEGAEVGLLNPSCEIFRNATILFESHHSREVIQSKILDPFSATHESHRISSGRRSHLDIIHLNRLTRW